LLLSTNFVDEGIRSCNVVVEDGLPSSRTVRSKLLFVSRKKPTVVILSDWRSNYFFNRCNLSLQLFGQTDVFVDEGIRSCKVVPEDGLSSSQTVKSKLPFILDKTHSDLSDWK